MKKILITTLFYFILSNNCFGQNDWESGYIIKNIGDTIFGFIDNRDSKSNSKQCYFKKEEKGETQIYMPQELLGYRFADGKFYISKKIEGHELGKPVFLEFLIHGKINVYHLQDDNDRYFVEKDSTLYELKNTEVLKYVNSTKHLINRNEYIGILTVLLNDADMQPDIINCELEAKSLIKIAKEYHEKVCSGEKCIIYEKSIKPIHVNKSVHAGVSINTINFGDEVISNYGLGSLFGFRLELENALNWQENLSIVLDFTLQRLTNYKLRANEDYTSYRIKYNNVDYTLNNNKEPALTIRQSLDVNIKTIALKIPFSINYTFSKGKIRPYIGTGIENTFIVSQNKDFIYKHFYNEFNRSIPVYQVGVVEKAGSKYMLKNNQFIYAELNYELNKSLNINQFLRFTNNLFSITLGYAF
ncbi:MAG TPA: hypothetical protein VFK73_09860 [Paludibacter sp.]|nr:hypothetical protein [Paludibacter sp.]